MDVAVIGGGIAGCAFAAFAAEAGASVEVFERERIAAAASGRNSGVVQHPMDPLLAPLFEETVSVGEVRFLDGTTLYVRIGDVVPWAGLVVAIGLWVLSARGRRRSTSAPPPPSGDLRAVDRS